jgi:hypothetical protein
MTIGRFYRILPGCAISCADARRSGTIAPFILSHSPAQLLACRWVRRHRRSAWPREEWRPEAGVNENVAQDGRWRIADGKWQAPNVLQGGFALKRQMQDVECKRASHDMSPKRSARLAARRQRGLRKGSSSLRTRCRPSALITEHKFYNAIIPRFCGFVNCFFDGASRIFGRGRGEANRREVQLQNHHCFDLPRCAAALKYPLLFSANV